MTTKFSHHRDLDFKETWKLKRDYSGGEGTKRGGREKRILVTEGDENLLSICLKMSS